MLNIADSIEGMVVHHRVTRPGNIATRVNQWVVYPTQSRLTEQRIETKTQKVVGGEKISGDSRAVRPHFRYKYLGTNPMVEAT